MIDDQPKKIKDIEKRSEVIIDIYEMIPASKSRIKS